MYGDDVCFLLFFPSAEERNRAFKCLYKADRDSRHLEARVTNDPDGWIAFNGGSRKYGGRFLIVLNEPRSGDFYRTKEFQVFRESGIKNWNCTLIRYSDVKASSA